MGEIDVFDKRILYFLQAIVSIDECRSLLEGEGGCGPYTMIDCLKSITPHSKVNYLTGHGEVSIPIVSDASILYEEEGSCFISTPKAYDMALEWLDTVVRSLVGHWKQLRPTWRVNMSRDLLLGEECYGMTQLSQQYVNVSVDPGAHKNYSELLGTLIHEVGHALTFEETAEHGPAWFGTTLSLIVATRLWGVLPRMANVGVTQEDLDWLPCSITWHFYIVLFVYIVCVY